MKSKPVRNGTLLLLSLIITVGMLVLSLAELPALTDIYHDYVSETVLRRFQVPLTSALPGWTKTPGEWSIVSMAFCLKVVGAIANLVLLVLIIRNSVGPGPDAQEPTTDPEAPGASAQT